MREPSFLSHDLIIHLLNDPLPVAILQDRCITELRGCWISSPMCNPEVDWHLSNWQIEIWCFIFIIKFKLIKF